MNKGIKMLLDPANLVLPKEWHPTKKVGRKAGTAARTERLDLRVMPELLQVLDRLSDEGWSMSGQSRSDIIHLAVKNLAKREFPDAEDEFFDVICKLDNNT